MNRKIFASLFAVILIVCMLMPMTVFAVDESGNYTMAASTNHSLVTFSDSNITAANLNRQSNELFNTSGVLVVKYKGVNYELLKLDDGASFDVNIEAFKACKDSEVTKAMKKFTDAISNSGGSTDTVQQIMNDMQDKDPSVSSIMLPLIFEATKGDMYQAYKITSPFLQILSVIMGVGAVVIIIFLLFSTVMDLVYIGLPVWRNTQQEKNGKGKAPFGVSYEAITTVNEVEQNLGGGNGGEYKNAYLLYLKHRALSYIVLAICIFYLIAGGLSGIISFVLQLVSGITG